MENSTGFMKNSGLTASKSLKLNPTQGPIGSVPYGPMDHHYQNYLHFMKNCIKSYYEKLKPLKSGFIENLFFENNRDPWWEHI